MFKNTNQSYNTPFRIGLLASSLLVCTIAHAISPGETKWARMPDARSSFDGSNLALDRDGNIYLGGSKDGYTRLVKIEDNVPQPTVTFLHPYSRKAGSTTFSPVVDEYNRKIYAVSNEGEFVVYDLDNPFIKPVVKNIKDDFADSVNYAFTEGIFLPKGESDTVVLQGCVDRKGLSSQEESSWDILYFYDANGKIKNEQYLGPRYISGTGMEYHKCTPGSQGPVRSIPNTPPNQINDDELGIAGFGPLYFFNLKTQMIQSPEHVVDNNVTALTTPVADSAENRYFIRVNSEPDSLVRSIYRMKKDARSVTGYTEEQFFTPSTCEANHTEQDPRSGVSRLVIHDDILYFRCTGIVYAISLDPTISDPSQRLLWSYGSMEDNILSGALELTSDGVLYTGGREGNTRYVYSLDSKSGKLHFKTPTISNKIATMFKASRNNETVYATICNSDYQQCGLQAIYSINTQPVVDVLTSSSAIVGKTLTLRAGATVYNGKYNVPAPNVEITFNGSNISNEVVKTNESGIATVNIPLPEDITTLSFSASIGSSKKNISVTTVPDASSAKLSISVNQKTAKVGEKILINTKVTDKYSNPISAENVLCSSDGGIELSAQDISTDKNGLSQITATGTRPMQWRPVNCWIARIGAQYTETTFISFVE